MLTIPTQDLLGVIGDVLPFVTDDKDAVEQRVIHLSWDGARLHACATDAIRAAVSSWDPDDPVDDEVQFELGTVLGDDADPWEFLLSVDDAGHLVKTAKPAKGLEHVPLLVDLDGQMLRVRRPKQTRVPGLVLTYDAVDAGFPDVRTLVVEAAGRVEPVKEIAFNMTLVAAFSKVRQRGGAARWTFGGDTHPAVVEIGDRFVGVIQPVRVANDAKAA